jgi:addiction module HigA family antidote
MLMYNPCHPGELIRVSMGRKITVTALAEHLGVTRPHLSMILNERAGLSPLMSLKLDETFEKSEGFWWGVQQQWDLAQARKIKRARLKPILKRIALQKAA